MVLRGTTVQLNSGLSAPKIDRPLCPARHSPSVAPVSCRDGARPNGHRELNLILLVETSSRLRIRAHAWHAQGTIVARDFRVGWAIVTACAPYLCVRRSATRAPLFQLARVLLQNARD